MVPIWYRVGQSPCVSFSGRPAGASFSDAAAKICARQRDSGNRAATDYISHRSDLQVPRRGVSRHHTTRYVLQYEVVLRLAPLKCGYVGCWRQAGIAAVNNVW